MKYAKSIKEIGNQKKKRRKEKKNRERPRGTPFGPEEEPARGPGKTNLNRYPSPLSLPADRPDPPVRFFFPGPN
jgi:hypothetical protein